MRHAPTPPSSILNAGRPQPPSATKALLVRALAAALATTIVALSAGAPPAHAGDYPMVLCGDSGTHRAGDWVSAISLFNTCAQGAGGAIGLSVNPNVPLKPGERIAMITTTPGAIRIVSADIAGALFGDINVGGDTAQRLSIDMLADGVRVYNTDLPQGATWNRLSDRVRVDVSPAQRFELGARCGAATNSCALYTSDPPFLGIEGATFQLRENDAPTIGNIAGPATADKLAAKPALALDASDADSGLRSAAVMLDGAVVGGADFAADCSYDSYRPCPASKSAQQIAVDTTGVPDGPHQLKVSVSDAAGNVATRTVKTVTVDNVPDSAGPPGGSGPLPPGVAYKLSATWLHNHRRTQTVGYRSSATLVGRLRNPDNTPLAGGLLSVSALPAGDSAAKTVQATTTSRGSFRVKITGRTRPQTVVVAFQPDPTHTGVGAFLRLGVRAKVTFGTSRRSVGPGGSVRFSGRVYAQGLPPRGVLAELQVLVPGSRSWRTFRTVRTAASGRFNSRYRFHAGGARYAFRARYRAQSGVSAGTGHSRALAVRVG